MKIYLLFIAIAAIQLATADYDIFFLRNNRRIMQGFQVLEPSQNTCPDPNNTRFFMDKNDVSGDKVGIRCVGSGCRHYRGDDRSYDPSNIEVMEMHLSNIPVIHGTIYKHGDGDPWEIFDVHGVSQGRCEPVSGDDAWFANCGEWSGFRKMRCHNYYTADFINAHDRGW